jgi:hypothetical protein
MSKLNLEEIEDSEAKAEIWREEEHESTYYKSLIEVSRTVLNKD